MPIKPMTTVIDFNSDNYPGETDRQRLYRIQKEINRLDQEIKESSDPLKSVYSGWAGDFSKVYSSITEAPRSFYHMCALVSIGNIIGDRITIESEISPQPTGFVVLLGETADTRKSTAINKTIEFITEVINDFATCYGIGSAEGLARKLKECKDVYSHKRMLLVFDELKYFVSKAKIKTSVLLETINTLFENNQVEFNTKEHSFKIEDIYLSMLGACTLDTYSDIFDSAFFSIGFCNRLFVIKDYGIAKYARPPKVNSTDKARLQNDLVKLVDKINKMGTPDFPYEMKMTPDADIRFQEWYLDLRSKKMESAKRLDTYADRFMILIAINDGKDEIDIDTVEKTITLMNYELRVRNEVDPIDADNQVAKMEQRIRRILLNGEITTSVLKKKIHYERHGIWVLESAIKNLRSSNEISYDNPSGMYSLVNVDRGEDL